MAHCWHFSKKNFSCWHYYRCPPFPQPPTFPSPPSPPPTPVFTTWSVFMGFVYTQRCSLAVPLLVFPLRAGSLFHVAVPLVLFCSSFILFIRFHIWVRSYGICLSLAGLLCLASYLPLFLNIGTLAHGWWFSHCEKQFVIPQVVKPRVTIWPNIPLWGTYTKDFKTVVQTKTLQMFMSWVFT